MRNRILVISSLALVLGIALFAVRNKSLNGNNQQTAQTSAGAAGSDNQQTNSHNDTAAGIGSTQNESAPSSATIASGAAAQATSASQTQTPSNADALASGCFNVVFKHKQLSGHDNLDACGNHRNSFKISAASLNKKSVCVRVDGTPVKFDLVQDKSKKDYIVTIANLAGPASKISARYCLGVSQCPSSQDDCTVPKDEFLDAIGGEDAAPAGQKISKNQKPAKAVKHAKWDNGDNQADAEVSDEIEGEIEKELHADQDLKVFDGWLVDSEAKACETKLGQVGQGGQGGRN